MRSFIFILLFFIPYLGYSQSNHPQISTNIKFVESFGYWENGESRGNYRVIVTSEGFEHIKDEVFIEMLKMDDNGDNSSILLIPVNEINDIKIFIVSDYFISGRKHDYQIRFQLLNTYSLEESELLIELNFDKYVLK